MNRLKSGASVLDLLEKDLQGEYAAISMYSKHIESIDIPEIKAKLEEIKSEEEHHVDELKELIDKYRG